MIEFEPIEWVLIETANQLGFDKKTYKERLEVGDQIFSEVKQYGVETTFKKYNPDEPELFARAVIALGDIAKGNPTNIIVGQDVASSGPQLYTVASRDSTGLSAVGAVDKIVNGVPVVPDLYTSIYEKLVPYGITGLSRKMVKEAVVPYAYGSTDSPRGTFGKWYPQFKKEYFNTIPAAATFKDLLIDAWNSDAFEYVWVLPDGFTATTVPTKNVNLRLQLFNSHSYTYITNEPCKLDKGDLHTKALSANVIHSLDAYCLREMHRRCNYDKSTLVIARNMLSRRIRNPNPKAEHLESLYWKYKIFSMEIAEVIQKGIGNISDEYIEVCLNYIEYLLSRKSFKLISIHDEFMTSPINCNVLKQTYNTILGELYCSDWLRQVTNALRGDNEADQYIEPINPNTLQQVLSSTYAIS